ncbi:hypothetical protein ScPMuIL_015973 [Solemya velum]
MKFKFSSFEVDDGMLHSAAVITAATFSCLMSGFVLQNIWRKYIVRQRIKRRREESKLSIQKMGDYLMQHGLSVDKRNIILDMPMAELQRKLQNGSLKALDVLRAYQSKAIEVTKDLNCVVEPIWEAEEQAIACDFMTGKKSPLHGIPVSLKENYHVQGYDSTGGMAKFIDCPQPDDNVIVKTLKEQGAIPFMRTNLPQTMMVYESSNPIYGETRNPHDPKRGPGGSSSGEGCLIGAGGSVLGFGTDIGGSLRIPAHMCGVCCLKPTVGRISTEGTHEVHKGATLVPGATGPLSRDVDGLVLAMKSLLVSHMFELDRSVPPIPFRPEIYEDHRPLRIGYFHDIGYMPSVPACERGVREVREILEKNGHTLIEFKVPRVDKALELFAQCVFGDGCKTFTDALKYDVVDPSFKLTYFLIHQAPEWLKRVAGFFYRTVGHDPIPKKVLVAAAGIKSVSKWWGVVEDLQAYRKKFEMEMRANKLDAIISPGFAYAAIPLGKAFLTVGAVAYTNLYNVINYPAGSLPVTKVTEEDEKLLENYPTKTLYAKNIKKLSKGSVGLPINVQFVAPPYQEELVLRLMKEVETSIKLGERHS